MIDADVKQLIKNLDERLTRVEQFLPALATKVDLAPLATRAEIALLATKAEVALLPTKAEIALLATKAEIALLATKAEIALLATKAEVALLATKAELREEGEKTRRHMDVVAEHITGQMAMLYESHTRHTERLDGHDARIHAVETTQIDLDLRVGALTRKPRRPR